MVCRLAWRTGGGYLIGTIPPPHAPRTTRVSASTVWSNSLAGLFGPADPPQQGAPCSGWSVTTALIEGPCDADASLSSPWMLRHWANKTGSDP